MNKPIESRIAKALYVVMHAVLLLILAACGLICMETIWRGSFSEALAWAIRFYKDMVGYILLVALLEATLYLICGRMFWAVGVTNALLMLLGVVQYYKLLLRGDAFVFSDLMLVAEAAGIIGNYEIEVPWFVLLSVIVLLGLPFCVIGMRLHIKAGRRVFSAALCMCMLLGSCNYLRSLNNERIVWFIRFYNRYGMIHGFLRSIPTKEEPPENYSEENVLALLEDYRQEDELQVKPDILFIMSETLYDIMQIDEFRISEDPLAYLRSLQAEHWGGRLYTQYVGAGTAQIEYEALSGYRSSADRITAYLDAKAVYEGMDSVPQLLRQYGYHTVAIHPNTEVFYNRAKAYPSMGFDECVFEEDMGEISERIGKYPTDAFLFDEIIRQYENRPKDQPWFSHVVTYQNHSDYQYEYEKKNIQVTDRDGNEKKTARTYVNALQASDEALKKLIAYFEKQDRPVVLVMFGDHAPSFHSIEYKEDDEFLLYTTPLLVYSNYGFTMPEDTPKTIASYRLGAMILHALGFRKDPYYNYLADPALPNLNNEEGWVVGEREILKDTQAYELAASQLRLMYYDRVYGKNYGKSE